MASKKTINCLNAALKAVDDIDSIDDLLKQQFKDDIRAILNSTKMDDGRAIIALEHRIKNAEQELLHLQMATKKAEEAAERIRTGRFDEGTGTLDEIEVVADALRRLISAKTGNRGDTVEGSFASLLRAETALLGGKLSPIIRFISDARGTVGDSEMAMVWMREVMGENTGNAEAKALAKLFHDTLAPYLTRLEKAGIGVDRIKDWFPQTHDYAKIMSQLDEWKAFLRANLDPEQHPDIEGAIEALLRGVAKRDWETVSNGRIGMRRSFKMKSPEAQAEYHQRFGEGNVTTTFLGVIQRIASEVSLAEKIGPMAQTTIDARAKELLQQLSEIPVKGLRANRRKARIRKDINRANNLVKFQQQAITDPANTSTENTMVALRNYMSGQALGKVTLSIVSEDAWGAAWQGRHLSGGVMRSIGNRFTAFSEVASNHGNLRNIAEGMGGYNHAVMANGLGRNAIDVDPVLRMDFSTGTLSQRGAALGTQYRTLTNRLSVASFLEQAGRGGNMVANARGVGRWLKQSWDEVPARLRKTIFENNGITREDWAKLRELEIDDHGMPNVFAMEIDNPVLFRKYMAMLLRESDLQVVMPDLETRFLLQGLIDPGAPREAVKIMTQFLSWSTAVWRGPVARDWQMGVPSFMIGAAGYTLSAGVSLQLYALAAGGIENTFEWDSSTLWWRALNRSAVAGPWLPMVFEGLEEGDIALPGIVPSRIIGLGASMGRGAQNVMDDETDKAAARMVKELDRTLVPNWWFIDGATNHIVNSIVEDLDPQAARRADRRKEREGRRGE